jgi:hypothetical protein
MRFGVTIGLILPPITKKDQDETFLHIIGYYLFFGIS